ncbi:hypothetical protein TorRG33x02_048700 [Trema orientale]|uniref:Uncharacterized protein n=1 Tax=Trema orientale TaxID=63057 RepID=A0A2P5FND1_TREOI|nr:hypothetical protein TorRG33x02_048700 [Trema orientale]
MKSEKSTSLKAAEGLDRLLSGPCSSSNESSISNFTGDFSVQAAVSCSDRRSPDVINCTINFLFFSLPFLPPKQKLDAEKKKKKAKARFSGK